MINSSKIDCISIIIPVYNSRNTLKNCIHSVLKQPYKNFEILLIDDGSTDYSSNECERFSQLDKRIKTYHLQHGGQSKARNFGLKHAKGQYVLFVDCDDTIDQKLLTLTTKYIKKFKTDFVMFDFDSNFPDNTKKNITYVINKGFYDRKKIKNEVFPKLIGQYDIKPVMSIAPWNKLYRKSFLIKNNISFVDCITVEEDRVFSGAVFYLSNSFYYLKNVYLYHYNNSLNSVSNVYKKDLFYVSKNIESCLTQLLNKDLSFFSQQINICVYGVLDRAITQEVDYVKFNKQSKRNAFKAINNIIKDPWANKIFKNFDLSLLNGVRKLELLAARYKKYKILYYLISFFPRGKTIRIFKLLN